MKKVEKVLISGNFNILHPGHLRLFVFAKELGNHLTVLVNSDNIAGSDAYVNEIYRLEALKSISYIDNAYIIKKNIKEEIKKYKPDLIIKGKEHENKYNEELEETIKYGGKIIFSSGEVTFSSFDLFEKEFRNKSENKYSLPNDFIKRHKINFSNLISIVSKFNNLNVIVIGDLIIDEYINCDPLGMSQEDPTIVVTPVDSKKYIGGAGIVAAHASGLNAKVDFITVTGEDDVANFAKSEFSKYNLKFHYFIDKSRPTTLKQRFRCKGKTLLRISHLHQGKISLDIQKKILTKYKQLIKNANVIIFSDFNYGCLPNELVTELINIAKEKNVFMVADSQSSSQNGDISRFTDMDLITPTEREARIALRDNENGLIILAENLRKIANTNNLLLKIGGDGVIIHSKDNIENSVKNDRIEALNKVPVDVAGAGDSMLVACSLSLALGNRIWESALLGSIAAAIQVSRVGNIPLQSKELLNSINKF
jgi:rfaE bifunctional protein kinase chain/domain